MLKLSERACYLLSLKLWAIIILAVVSCAVQKPKRLLSEKEGIEGYLYQKNSNQMPMKGKPQQTGKGIACELWIYKATTLQQASGQVPLFDQINTQFVATTKTDSTGHYRIALPPGRYSVFVKQNHRYFAAETNGQGILNPAEVIPGKITKLNITVTSGALY